MAARRFAASGREEATSTAKPTPVRCERNTSRTDSLSSTMSTRSDMPLQRGKPDASEGAFRISDLWLWGPPRPGREAAKDRETDDRTVVAARPPEIENWRPRVVTGCDVTPP